MRSLLLFLCLAPMLHAADPAPASTAKPDPTLPYCLDRKTISSLAPVDLASKVMDNLIDYLRKKEDFYVAALQLPPQWRVVFTTSTLESTTTVDGLGDFFGNTGGKFNAVLEGDLRFIGALPYLPLFAEARKVADAISPKDSADTREKKFESIQSAFYKEFRCKGITGFLGEFIKAHPDLYAK
jgi:hypothetical protein